MGLEVALVFFGGADAVGMRLPWSCSVLALRSKARRFARISGNAHA